MGMYDKYVKKLNYIYIVKKFIYRFRIIILAVISLITAGILTYCFTKGSFSGSILINENFTYGDEIVFEEDLNSFSASYYFEYALKGKNEWTTNKPTSCGDYLVRAVSENAFGMKKYSEEKEFHISPKQISIFIANDEINYASYFDAECNVIEGKYDNYTDDLKNVSSGLVKGDTIDKTYSYVYSSFEDNDTYFREEFLINSDTLKIYNDQNNDVTSMYQISFISRNVKVNKQKINININFSNSNLVYNGNYLTNDFISLNNYENSLLYNDSLVFDEDYYSITNSKNETKLITDIKEADIYKVNVDKTKIHFINVEGNDINKGYYVTINNNDVIFSIAKRNVYIKPQEENYVYDGEMHELKTWVYASNSINNEEYQFVGEDKDALEVTFSYINNSSDVNSYEGYISSINDNDILNNYKISFAEKTKLIISKRTVYIRPEDINSYIYDGYEHTFASWTYVEGTSEEHKFLNNDENYLNIEYSIYKVNAGTYEGYISSYGNDSHLANYDINIEASGTLVISKRDVYIKPTNVTYTYNGEKQGLVSFEYTGSSIDDSNYQFINLYYDYFNISFAYEEGKTPIDAGTYVGYITSLGNHAYLDNYNIHYEDETGIVTISQRNIYLKPVSTSYVYDASTHTFEGIEYTSNSMNDPLYQFVSIDNISLDDLEVTYEFYGLTNEPINAGDYIGYIENINHSSPKINNYKLHYGSDYSETLTIERREVNITPNNISYVYDGEEHTFVSWSYVEGTSEEHMFLNNDEEAMNVTYIFENNVKPVNVGTYEGSINIDNLGDDSRLNNYIINSSTAILTITPRQIYIKPQDTTCTYDGYEHTFASWSYVEGTSEEHKFLNNDENYLNIEYSISKVNAGTYVGYISSYGNDSHLANYDINIEASGTLVISKRDVYIKPTDVTYTYNGEEQGLVSFEYTGSSIDDSNYQFINLYYDYFNISFAYEEGKTPIDAGTYVGYITSLGNHAYLDNYNIHYEDETGIVTISQRNIYLKPVSTSYVYDASTHTFEGIEYTSNSMNDPLYQFVSIDNISLDSLEVTYAFNGLTNEPINAGDYIGYIENINHSSPKINNYKLHYGSDYSETLTIERREVNITPNNISYVYDGEEHTFVSWSYVEGTSEEHMFLNNDEEAMNVTYIFENNVKPVNVGTYEGSINIDNLGDDSRLNNYIINSSTAILTITPRQIYIKPQDTTCTYDGYEHTFASWTYVEGTSEEHKFLNNDENYLNIEYSIYKVNAGTYEGYISSYGNDSHLANYDINIEASGTLVISKRDVYIKPTNVTYTYNGEKQGLVSFEYTGSSIDDSNYQFINLYYDYFNISFAYEEGKTPIDAGTYVGYITSLGNHAYLDNYNIHYEDETGIVTISQRNIYLKPVSTSYVYDASTHTFEGIEYTSNSMNDPLYQFVSIDNISLDDLEVTYEFYGLTNEPINAGDYIGYIENINHSSPKINNYKLHYGSDYSETLTIERREVNITPNNISYVYDGEEHTFVSWSYVEGTSEEHMFLNNDEEAMNVTYIFENNVKPVNVGTYEGSINIDNLGDDSRLNNYIINSSTAILTITPRQIYIKPQDTTCTYDGYEHTFASWTYVEGTSEEHKFLNNDENYLNIEYSISKVNAGTYVGYISSYGNDSHLDNYDINIEASGTLVISKRDVYIKPTDVTYTYNGEKQGLVSFEYTGSSIDDNNYQFINFDIAYFDISFAYEEGKTPIDAGTYVGYITSLGTNTYLDNYNIHYEDETGTVRISQRDIYLKPVSTSYVYDASTHTFEGIEYTSNSMNDPLYQFVSIDNISLDDLEVTYEFYGLTNEPINAGDYIGYIENINHSSPKINNYKLHYGSDYSETLTIERREVNITPNNISYVYDGEEHTFVSWSYVEGTSEEHMFLNNDEEAMNVTYIFENNVKPVNVGTYEGSINIDNLGDDSRLNNYIISSSTAILTITQREIIVTFKNGEKTYNGQEFSYGEQEIQSKDVNNLVDGHVLYLNLEFKNNNVTSSSIINVGTYDLVISSYIVRNEDGEIIFNSFNADNYSLHFLNEYTYIINPYTFIINPFNETKVYDGKEYESNLTIDLPFNGIIVKVDSLSYVNVNAPNTVGEYSFIIEKNNCSVINGDNSILDNYIFINETYSKLTITQREITFKPYDTSKVYDGEFAIFTGDYSYSSLGEGDNVTSLGINVSYKVVNDDNELVSTCGTYRIVMEVTGNNYFNQNYKLIIEEGIYIITQREYLVKLNYSHSITFDGEEHDFDSVNGSYSIINDDSLSTSLIINIRFKDGDEVLDTIFSKGIYEIIISSFNIEGIENNSNYKIEFVESYSIEITSYTITYVNPNINVTYDGNKHPYTKEELERNNDSILETESRDLLEKLGYKVTRSISQSLDDVYKVNAGTYEYNLEISIIDSNGNDQTSNFNINSINGKIIIAPKVINVSVTGDTKYYDNKAYSLSNDIKNSLKEQISQGLLDCDKDKTINISFKNGNNYIKPGTYNNFSDDIVFKLTSSSEDTSSNYKIIYDVKKSLEILKNVIYFIDNKEETVTYNGESISNINKYLEIDGEKSTLNGVSISVSKVTIIDSEGDEYEYDAKDSSFKNFKILKNVGTYTIKINVNDIYLNNERIGDNLNSYCCDQEEITLTIIISQFSLSGYANTSNETFAFDIKNLDKKYYSEKDPYYDIEPTSINGREIYFKFVPYVINGVENLPYVDIYNKSCINKLDLRCYFKDTNEDITDNLSFSNVTIKYGTLTLTTDVNVRSVQANDYTSLDEYSTGPNYISSNTSINIYYETQYILVGELDVGAETISEITEVGTYYLLYTIKNVSINGIIYEDYSFLNLQFEKTLTYNGETYFVLEYVINQSKLYLKPYIEDDYVFKGNNVSIANDQVEIVYGKLRVDDITISVTFTNGEIGFINNEFVKSTKPIILTSSIYNSEGKDVTKNYDIRYEYDDYLKNLDEELKGKERYLYKFSVNKTLMFSNRYVVYISYGDTVIYDGEYHSVTTEPTIVTNYNEAIEQTTNRNVSEENYGLLDGYTYEIKSYSKYMYPNSKGYKNNISFKTYKDGIDVSSVFTYLISSNSEMIYINQKDVIIKSSSASMQFGDELELTCHVIASINGLLDNGDYIDESSIVWTGVNSTVGTKQNTFEVTRILNEKGQNVIKYYNIIYEYGDLTIYL